MYYHLKTGKLIRFPSRFVVTGLIVRVEPIDWVVWANVPPTPANYVACPDAPPSTGSLHIEKKAPEGMSETPPKTIPPIPVAQLRAIFAHWKLCDTLGEPRDSTLERLAERVDELRIERIVEKRLAAQGTQDRQSE